MLSFDWDITWVICNRNFGNVATAAGHPQGASTKIYRTVLVLRTVLESSTIFCAYSF